KYVIKELEKIPANNIITNKSNLKFIDSLKYNIGFNLLKIDTWHIWSAAFGMFKSIQEYDAYNEKLPSILFPLAQEMIDKNNIEKAKDVYFFLKDKYSNNREVNYIKFRIDSLKDENLYKLALNKYDEHKYRGVLSELNQMNKESHLAKEKQDLYSKIEKNIIDLANTKNSLESYYSNQFNKCGSHSNLRNKLYELGFAEIESYLGNSDDTQNTFIYVFHITNGDFNIELTEWRNYVNIWIWKLNVENKYPEW
ncbi:MAG: hypothetical protein NTU73_15015, partial [Ignavibacteriae bacterium]|nr:hypothetical protein [Ignavibacteriota bacterium]